MVSTRPKKEMGKKREGAAGEGAEGNGETKEKAEPSRKFRYEMRNRGDTAPHYLCRSWASWVSGVVGFLWSAYTLGVKSWIG